MFRNIYSNSVTGIRYFNRRTLKPPKERRPTPQDYLWQLVKNSSIKTIQDWKPVRQEILNLNRHFTPQNIDARIINVCATKKQFDLAFKYFEYLHQEGIQPNLATLGNYLKLMYSKSVDNALTPQEEQLILSMYDKIRQTYPVLDCSTLESIILGVSKTKKWELCMSLIEEMKVTMPPTPAVYNAVISAAFLNNADDLAWKLFKELIENNRPVLARTYSSFLQKITKYAKPEMIAQLDKLCVLMQEHNIKLDSASLGEFVNKLKGQGLSVNTPIISHRGVCTFCNNNLQTFELTDSEFNNLKTYIFQNVIVGKDVFIKTTPDELVRFKEFVSNMKPFDVVVDGLNVAYSVGTDQSPMVTSGLVSAVVSHFVNKNKTVLVLGRTHMNKWPKQNWSYVCEHATVFLTQDISQDDPYLLYCALNAGNNTMVITRDLMRGHKFLLKNAKLKWLFDRWLTQRQHQLVRVRENGVPIFKRPMPFSTIVQKNGTCWHLPSTPEPSNKVQEYGPWLCINCE